MSFSNYILSEMAMKSLNDEALFVIPGEVYALYSLRPARIALARSNWTDLKETILAAITVRYNDLYKVTEVDRVAGKQGYGPLIYMIAMADSERGLAPNRTPQVSQDASNVWQNFHAGVGSTLVNRRALPKAAQEHHPEQPHLNMRYKLRQNTQLLQQIEAAKLRNNTLLSRDPYGEKHDMLHEAIEGFLGEEMTKVYPYPGEE